MEQLPPRPSVSGFAQRLWDNMYNPQARQTLESANSLRSDVHNQLRQGQSLRQLLKVVEHVLEGTVDIPATSKSTPNGMPRRREAVAIRPVSSHKKARTSMVAPFIEPVAPKLKVKDTPVAVASSELPMETLMVPKRPSKQSAAKENLVQYVRRIFGKGKEKSSVEVVKRRKQSPLVSTMASLLY